ncbi:hypothetical protein ACNAW0_28865 [Micromonospora sp. SL1-18]|uniref:hypothetical protein n=1 Tax=Micromonospora sp. SL1-18 TaxID=3399128 RepID=UPI003A4DA8A9
MNFISSYCNGEEILGEVIDRPVREQLWAGIPVGHALSLLSGMLRDLDLGDPPVQAVEASWTSALTGPARKRALDAVMAGRRLLPPQLLLVALKEALRYCPAGAARDDLSDLDLVLRAVWSIGDELGQVHDDNEPLWGGIKASLAAELMANQYFNVTAHPLPLIARTQATWRGGWAPSVDPQLQARAGGQPAELFAQATGCELDAFLGLATHLWVQAEQHRYQSFPLEFFRRTGIAQAAVERFLDATSVSLSDLQRYATGHDATEHPWDFNELRLRPIVRFPDGSVQVIRLGFVLERAFGQVPEFDVRNYLRGIDSGKDLTVKGGREEAFRLALNTQFEHSVGEILRRIFPATGHLRRVYTENDMWHAWGTTSSKPKVCDWVVDCGDMWLCLDATNRRLSQPVAGGFASPAELDREVNAVLAGRKASQVASTIRHLTQQLPRLAGRNLPPGTRFVPLIITPEDGLPCNPGVHRRVEEIVAATGTLQTSRATPLGVITLSELSLLEGAAEDGFNVGDLLHRWRSRNPGVPLQNFLDGHNVPLRRPKWETDTFGRVMDEFLEQMTHHQSTRTDS